MAEASTSAKILTSAGGVKSRLLPAVGSEQVSRREHTARESAEEALHSALPDLSALTTFDERLREFATDADAVTAAIEAAEASLATARTHDDDHAVRRLLGYLGNGYRILGCPTEAIARLQECFELADASNDARGRTVARIRLGEAYRCCDRLEESEMSLRAALAETHANARLADVRDFALQHLGKCLTDQGRVGEAVTSLEEALSLRKRKRNKNLIASTELALARAKSSSPGDGLVS